MSTHSEPHSCCPMGQTHAPFVHACVGPQASPHIPQLSRSFVKSAHVPAQKSVPGGQLSLHVPPRHAMPAVHVLPHAPQFSGSLCVPMHVPLHSIPGSPSLVVHSADEPASAFGFLLSPHPTSARTTTATTTRTIHLLYRATDLTGTIRDGGAAMCCGATFVGLAFDLARLELRPTGSGDAVVAHTRRAFAAGVTVAARLTERRRHSGGSLPVRWRRLGVRRWRSRRWWRRGRRRSARDEEHKREALHALRTSTPLRCEGASARAKDARGTQRARSPPRSLARSDMPYGTPSSRAS